MKEEPGTPPIDKRLIGFTIWSIDPFENRIVDKPLENNTWAIVFKPKMEGGIKVLSIRVIFTVAIDDKKHIYHMSKTDYATNGLSIGNLHAGDDTIDLLVELGLTAIAHSRMLFQELNKNVTTNIPPLLFSQNIRREVVSQFEAIS